MKKLFPILFISLFIFSCDSDSNPVGLQCESSGLIEQDGLCVDECGEVNGDNSTCTDECGVPNGDNSTCTDDCGIVNGNNLDKDCSGICFGNYFIKMRFVVIVM